MISSTAFDIYTKPDLRIQYWKGKPEIKTMKILIEMKIQDLIWCQVYKGQWLEEKGNSVRRTQGLSLGETQTQA